jgi:hypothetical protein
MKNLSMTPLKRPFIANRTVGARGPSPLREPIHNSASGGFGKNSLHPLWKRGNL